MPSERNIGELTLYPSANTSADWADVDAAVRNNSFFSACIEDERLLSALQKLVAQAAEEGWSVGMFVDEALQMLDDIASDPETRDNKKLQDGYNRLYDVERLQLIYTTQRALSAGYKRVCEAFSPFQLRAFPGWAFIRQPGAREEYKRKDHVTQEGSIRLKTDIEYWLMRNREEIGGFGNPYGPWGFNSWMIERPVDRKTVEEMGLLKPGEEVKIPPDYAKWGIGNTLKQLGQAGVSDLTPEQQQTVVDRCEDEGITVTKTDDNHLQVTPDPSNPDDPLDKIDEEATLAWLEAEAKKQMAEIDEQALWEELLREAEETM